VTDWFLTYPLVSCIFLLFLTYPQYFFFQNVAKVAHCSHDLFRVTPTFHGKFVRKENLNSFQVKVSIPTEMDYNGKGAPNGSPIQQEGPYHGDDQ
jgi:hypothetical protein